MSTGEGAVAVLFGWEGNRRFGVALIMRQRLCGVCIYGLSGLRKGVTTGHPVYTPVDTLLTPTHTQPTLDDDDDNVEDVFFNCISPQR